MTFSNQIRLSACVARTFLILVTSVSELPAKTLDASAQPGGQQPAEPTWTLASGATLTLFPSGDIYPVYVADPHRTTNAILLTFCPQPRIPETRSPQATLSAGGRFGMLGIEPATKDGRAWQISIDAGLDTIFDTQFRNDAIAWEGNYGLTATTARGSLAVKIAVLHVSSHIGDDYQERTLRPRINYTREEVAVGASWRWSEPWRAYGEVGFAYRQGAEEQEPGRLQVGLEHESRFGLWQDRFTAYWAADFSSMQERDWRLDTSLQGGLVARSNGRAYRLLLQFHNGRPPVGEFFQYSEIRLSLGLTIDF
jgi:hypothetical protein